MVGCWIPMAVLTGLMSAQLIHWGALIKARVLWGPLTPLTPAHRSVKQLWAFGFWTGLLSTSQTLWESGAGVKALTVDMFLFVSHRNSVAPTTPWALPSLWWTSSVSASPTMAWEVCGLWLSCPEVFTQSALVFLSCAGCSISCLSKLIDMLECTYEECILTLLLYLRWEEVGTRGLQMYLPV